MTLSISSHTGTVYLMLKQPSEWKEVLKSSQDHKITEVVIFLDLSTVDTTLKTGEHAQWEECISGVIDTFKPQIIHVHHNNANTENVKGVIEAVNNRRYLMQPSRRKWIIWSR